MDKIILLWVTISSCRCTSTSEANRRRGAVGSQLDPRPPHAWSADKLQLRNCRGLKWSRQVLSHKDSRGIKVGRFSNWFGIAVVATFKGVIQGPDWGFFLSIVIFMQAARFDALLRPIHWFLYICWLVHRCTIMFYYVLFAEKKKKNRFCTLLHVWLRRRCVQAITSVCGVLERPRNQKWQTSHFKNADKSTC